MAAPDERLPGTNLFKNVEAVHKQGAKRPRQMQLRVNACAGQHQKPLKGDSFVQAAHERPVGQAEAAPFGQYLAIGCDEVEASDAQHDAEGDERVVFLAKKPGIKPKEQKLNKAQFGRRVKQKHSGYKKAGAENIGASQAADTP